MANPWSSTGGQAKSRPGLAEPDLPIYGVVSAHRDHARYSAPTLDPDYFSDPDGVDLRTLVDGVRLSRRIAAQPALAALRLREITPSAEAASDAEVALYVRRHCQSIYHPTSTCRMGTDA